MSGFALYGATEHNARDFPGVYLGNVCGVRFTQEVGAGGLVLNPVCVPGSVYEDSFVSPVSGGLKAVAHLRTTLSGSSALLTILVDDTPVGALDLLTLESDMPFPIPIGAKALAQGQSVITVRVACTPDVDPGAGLELTLIAPGA